jgi:hypothetical protein
MSAGLLIAGQYALRHPDYTLASSLCGVFDRKALVEGKHSFQMARRSAVILFRV